MRKSRQAGRWPVPVVVAVLTFATAAGILLFSGAASATASIQVSPDVGLTAGTNVSVTGTEFDASSAGGIAECNNDPGQPTVSVLGNNVPVSCTNPLNNLHSTDANGSLSATIAIVTGITGPPGTGTDSSGGDAATDAASYPCPPTQAQIDAGDSCVISFGDQGGAAATNRISFSSSTTPTTGPGTTSTTTTSTSTTTTTTSTTAGTGPTTTPTTALPGFLTVVAGQPTMIQGAGFSVGEQVTVAIHSTSIQLAVSLRIRWELRSGRSQFRLTPWWVTTSST